MEELARKLNNERNELSDNINKLSSFLETDKYLSLPTIQQSLLRVQLTAMLTYKECLWQRILNL